MSGFVQSAGMQNCPLISKKTKQVFSYENQYRDYFNNDISSASLS